MDIKRTVDSIKNRTYKLCKEASKKIKQLIPSKPNVEEILKDLEENHNHSWYQEIFDRNKNTLNDIALLYKGTKITYGEMFYKINQYAKSLRSMGIGEGSEIPVCLSNCPEIVYLMGAASLIGAKLNIFGPNYPTDYITEIINGTNSDVIFVEDNYYEKIRPGIDASKIKKIVAISLVDSLKNNNNPYMDLELNPEIYVSKVSDMKKKNPIVVSQSEFITEGKDYKGKICGNSDMDVDFVITYTSGSTNEKRPKAIIHSQRSFITVGRFHDTELNGGGTSVKPFTILAHIPTYSNSNLVSCISDCLMQGAKLALEPNYNQDQFLHTLMMYQPHYVAATKSFWVNICKKILFDKRYRNVKFENLFIACSCGESFELNEEALVNEVMKKAKMGTNVTHTPFSVVKMSEAAGDCEHGSIFYTLFRAYGNLKRKNRRNGDAEGVKPIAFVEVAVLDEKGNHLPPYQYGRLVANSPCTMKGYKNNPEATRDFFITDSSGKVWGDMNVYGYLDDSGKAHIRGRIPKEGELIPPFVIAKEILRDLKNILSCEVIKDATTGIYIAHVELQPTTKNNPADILAAAQERCNSLLNKYGIKLCYRLRSFDESYPLTGSGKRDVKALVREGLTEKCVIPVIEDEKAVLKKYISEDEIKKIK